MEIPYDLFKEYIGPYCSRQSLGRIYCTCIAMKYILHKDLESRRFRPTNRTIREAVGDYLNRKKYGHISGWDVSNVTNMMFLFHSMLDFNEDLSKWDVSQVKYMYGMFSNAISFNGDLSEWNVSNVIDMGIMFDNAKSFNGDISGWNVNNVKDFRNMFWNTIKFNPKNAPWYFKFLSTKDYQFREQN